MAIVLAGAPSASGIMSIPEASWRSQAVAHSNRMRKLLEPGFVATAEHLSHANKPSARMQPAKDGWKALDPKHPVYNFMLEYYALKGAKSMRRLGRWSPALDPEGVRLEGAIAADVESGCLSPRGALFEPTGIVYDPRAFQRTAKREQCTSFLWYRSILAATSTAVPILNCDNLHEVGVLRRRLAHARPRLHTNEKPPKLQPPLSHLAASRRQPPCPSLNSLLALALPSTASTDFH